MIDIIKDIAEIILIITAEVVVIVFGIQVIWAFGLYLFDWARDLKIKIKKSVFILFLVVIISLFYNVYLNVKLYNHEKILKNCNFFINAHNTEILGIKDRLDENEWEVNLLKQKTDLLTQKIFKNRR